MKKQILPFIVLTFVSSFALANNLTDYRKIYQSSGQGSLSPALVSGAAQEDIRELRQFLGTANNTISEALDKEISKNLNGMTNADRSRSSSFVKIKLEKGMLALAQMDSANKNVLLIQGNESESDLYEKINSERRIAIIKAIDTVDRTKSSRDKYGDIEGGLNQLYRQYYDQTIFALEDKNDLQNKKIHPIDPAVSARLLSLIRSTLAKQPSGAMKIEDALGNLTSVEVYDGIVNKLDFMTAKNVPSHVSLSMLLTIRGGEDRYFLEVEKFFLQNARDQRYLFQLRLKDLAKEDIDMSQDERVAYMANLRFHLDGRDVSDKEYMNSRITLLDKTIPVIESKLKDSVVIHNEFSQLNSQQISFLTDLFIQLRGLDIPTAEDISGLKSVVYRGGRDPQFVKDIGISQGELGQDIMTYRGLRDQLLRLETYLRFEKDRDNSKNKILNGGRK